MEDFSFPPSGDADDGTKPLSAAQRLNPLRQGPRGTRHQIDIPPDAPRFHGTVVSRQEKFGFIKAAENDSRYFFHLRDSDGKAPHGASVSFVVAHDITAGKDVAYAVTTVSERPRGRRSMDGGRRSLDEASRTHQQHNELSYGSGHTSSAGGGIAIPSAAGGSGHRGQGREEKVEGAFSGVVTAVPMGPAGARIDDGMIVFADASGAQAQAMYGAWRIVAGTHPPGLGERVDFGLVKNPANQIFKAINVHRVDGNPLEMAVASAHAALAGLAVSPRAAAVMSPRAAAASRSAFGQPPSPSSSLEEARRSTGAAGAAASSFSVSGSAGEGRAAADGGGGSGGTAAAAGGGSGASGALSKARHLGRVTLLKKDFGFIRQVVRPGDLFFHFSELKGISPEDIKVGDDVEFGVRRDHDGKSWRESAHGVARAPLGSVAFEEISKTQLQGVVLERAVVTKHYAQSSGVLEYSTAPDASAAAAAAGGENAGAGGSGSSAAAPLEAPLPPPKLRMIFAAADCVGGAGALRPGDHVAFRIATNIAAAAAAATKGAPPAVAQLAGRRAVEVVALSFHGHVASVHTDRKFGFIVYLVAAAAEKGGAAGGSGGGRGSGATAVVAPASASAAGEREEAPQQAQQGGEPSSESSAAKTASRPLEPAFAAAASHGGVDGGAGTVDAAAGGEKPGKTRKEKEKETLTGRVFFHFSEVQGGVTLRPGDEVTFALHTNLKSGEQNAARVRRTKAVPEQPLPPKNEAREGGKSKAAKGAEAAPSGLNPNKLKLTGNLQSGEHKMQYKPTMPDGTRGFGLGRGKSLDAAAAAAPGSAPFQFFGGLRLRGMGRVFSGILSVEAKPFEPVRAASSEGRGGGEEAPSQ